MAKLPRVYRGDLLDVTTLNDDERNELGLSSDKTIIEVIGDDLLVQEAYDYAATRGVTGFDEETSGLRPYKDDIVLVQMGDEERQYIIWYDTIDPKYITKTLKDKRIVKVGTNIGFDLKMWVAKHGFDARARNVVDTQLMEQILTCGLTGKPGQTLKLTAMEQQVARWLGLEIPKDIELRTKWEKMEPGNWETYRDGTPVEKGKKYYAADDVPLPKLVYLKQKPWIKRFGLVSTVNLEHQFLPVRVDMEARGIKLNKKKWLELYVKAVGEVKEAEEQLDQIFDVTQTITVDEDGKRTIERDKNYASTDQLADLLHDWMLEKYGIWVLARNRHFKAALEAQGEMSQARIDKLFTPRKEPNPANPKKMKKIASPSGTDLLAKTYDRKTKKVHSLPDTYKVYLPEKCFVLDDTESDTLDLLRIVWETEDPDVELAGTTIGLPPELVEPILALRGSTKKAQTYGVGWFDRIDDKTGRVHADFLQGALDTGRLSSSPNIQNLPADAEYRKAFEPERGYKYVGADWDQIEPRVIAQLSKDETYMRVFWSALPGSDGYRAWCYDRPKESLDLYTEVGKIMGLIPPHYTKLDTKGDENAKPPIEPKKDGKEGRKQSKITVLSLGYGTGIPKFWKALCVDLGRYVPKEFAANLYHSFWGSVQSLKETLDIFSDLVDPKQSGRRAFHPYVGREVTWSESLAGRKRFFDYNAPSWWTQGRNHPIQSLAGGDILKEASVVMANWMWEEGIEGGIVNLIHDEVIIECLEEDAERVKAKLLEVMQEIGEHYCSSVPITAVGYIEDFWKKD